MSEFEKRHTEPSLKDFGNDESAWSRRWDKWIATREGWLEALKWVHPKIMDFFADPDYPVERYIEKEIEELEND